jgi:SAM-dependent methyltransferase
VYVADIVHGMVAGRALDLACGEGRNAIWLAQQGWDVTAVDFASVAIDRARTRAEHAGVEVAFAVADVLTYDMAAASFDLVVLCFLQLPDHERRPVWKRAAAAVAPDGTLLVIGHDTRNVADGFGGPKDAAVCYTATDITAVVGSSLRIESAGTRAPELVQRGQQGDACGVEGRSDPEPRDNGGLMQEQHRVAEQDFRVELLRGVRRDEVVKVERQGWIREARATSGVDGCEPFVAPAEVRAHVTQEDVQARSFSAACRGRDAIGGQRGDVDRAAEEPGDARVYEPVVEELAQHARDAGDGEGVAHRAPRGRR